MKPNIVTCQQLNYPDQVVFFISTCMHTFTCWNRGCKKLHSNELTPINIFILFSRRSIFVTLQHLNLKGGVANLKIEKRECYDLIRSTDFFVSTKNRTLYTRISYLVIASIQGQIDYEFYQSKLLKTRRQNALN